jgi:pimeloyl-ACP methyl ester carboxylesterase
VSPACSEPCRGALSRVRFPEAMTSAIIAVAVLLQTAPTAAAVSRTVTFRTEDGVNIAATFHEAERRPAPAVILLHMLGRSREDWRGVADRLADAGIHALAIDFRGHGGSSSGPAGPDGGPDLSRMTLDVNAARAYLASRPDLVQASAIGIAGASIGASVAIISAAADESIKSLALLSPAMEYRSLRADAPMRKYGARPALLVAGTNDPYAMRSVKELAALGGGLREIKTIDAAGHGTVMLDRDPDLSRALVDWFQRTLL